MTVGRRTPKYMENAAWATLQRQETIERSNGRCEFEVAFRGVTLGETHVRGQRIVEREHGRAWARCGAQASDTAHLIRRHKCGIHLTDEEIPLKFHPYVAIAGCRPCHGAFDSNLADHEVRAPADRMAICKALVDHTLLAAEARCEAVIWPWPRPA
jgi:hypothetical protein